LAARRSIPAVISPEWPPDRSLRAVQKQLQELSELKALHFNEGQPKEQAWKQVTESVLRRGFRSDSPIPMNFLRAGSAGQYNIMGVSAGTMQNNFHARISAYEIALNTAVADLKMSLPEEEIQGVYESGQQYEFCRDVRTLMHLATQETLIIDPYLDPELFDVYIDSLAPNVAIHVLTANPKPNISLLAEKFARGRSNFELREATSLHDRALFVDDRCWVIGQSMKDAASKKSTYIVEHSNELMREVYQQRWNAATSVVKS
jgi:hypothetical protein